MMTNSCSFRITRTAEDLAQTINALSQRLVKLEQRLEALELEFQEEGNFQQPDEEIKMLDGVDHLLKECQTLLESSADVDDNAILSLEDEEEQSLAA